MSDSLHPSHKTRISMDASSWDEICIFCGYTDRLGSWGKLAEPCTNVPTGPNPDLSDPKVAPWV